MKFLDDTPRGATFSSCRRYRWTLWRRWDWSKGDDGLAAFIGVNPSTADEFVNDRTITRCINFSKDWGYSGYVMLNLFAWRETKPEIMRKVPSPIGERNDEAILDITGRCGLIVACWGDNGLHLGRSSQVRSMLADAERKVWCLALTNSGEPGHPLYLSKETPLIPWLT